MKAELKGLPVGMAEIVGGHLAAAGHYIDSDPELAYRHADAARRRAARLPITREAAAETAYAAGHYETALNEFRTLRRMSGSADFVPVMADCLRALGRYRDALALIAEGIPEITDAAMVAEAIVVQAGIRSDMGEAAEARRILRDELDRPHRRYPALAQAHLWYAYAALLDEAGDTERAHTAYSNAAALDTEEETAAQDHLDLYDGVTFDLDEYGLADDAGTRLDDGEDDDETDVDERQDDLDDEDDQLLSDEATDPQDVADDTAEEADEPDQEERSATPDLDPDGGDVSDSSAEPDVTDDDDHDDAH